MANTRVAVCGSSPNDGEEIIERTSELGELLAKRGHVVLTGGGDGLPYIAAASAKKHGGSVEAFSPALDIEEHTSRFKFPTDAFTKIHFRPKDFELASVDMACLKLRNVFTIASCDAVIFVKGKTGTLNEFTIAYDMGKIIGALRGAGGVADQIPELVKLCNKPMGSVVVLHSNPAALLSRLEAAHAERSRPS